MNWRMRQFSVLVPIEGIRLIRIVCNICIIVHIFFHTNKNYHCHVNKISIAVCYRVSLAIIVLYFSKTFGFFLLYLYNLICEWTF